MTIKISILAEKPFLSNTHPISCTINSNIPVGWMHLIKAEIIVLRLCLTSVEHTTNMLFLAYSLDLSHKKVALRQQCSMEAHKIIAYLSRRGRRGTVYCCHRNFCLYNCADQAEEERLGSGWSLGTLIICD